MEVKSIFNSEHKDIEGVCVTIARPEKKRNQQHVGFLYPDIEGNIKFLHFAWHHDLRKENPNKKYVWLEIPIEEDDQANLITFLELVYDENKDRIPYSICIKGTGFADSGTFTAKEQYDGLTCATFVIQVLEHFGYKTIDFKKWKSRKGDKVWQGQIINTIKHQVQLGKIPKDHLKHQQKKLLDGASRFKPEEVAVAATLPDPPHGPKVLKKPTQQLINKIADHNAALAKQGKEKPTLQN